VPIAGSVATVSGLRLTAESVVRRTRQVSRPARGMDEDRRCPERNIRADALDEFVFAQIRAALTQPGMLLAGEHAIAVTAPVPDDELLAAEFATRTAGSTPPQPNGAGSPTSTRPGSSTCPSCTAAPAKSPPACATCAPGVTPSPPGAPPWPTGTCYGAASPTSPGRSAK
jgi:hypothetical protein